MSEHDHPLTDGEVKKEIVPSITFQDEGCEEHYNERVIKSDGAYDGATIESVKIANPYLKAMVLGEVLSTPRCRVPYRKK